MTLSIDIKVENDEWKASYEEKNIIEVVAINPRLE